MIIKRKTQIFLALLVLNVFLFQSCATIGRGTYQKIPVTSNPSGAKVIVEEEEMGYTPLNLTLKRKKGHIIRIERQGYNPVVINTTRATSAIRHKQVSNKRGREFFLRPCRSNAVWG